MFFMSTKSTKSIKITKRIQATFLFLDVFYVHKKHKKYKKHKKCKKRKKAQNVKHGAFFLLDAFNAHKNAAFFVSIRLYAFYTFCACEIFL